MIKKTLLALSFALAITIFCLPSAHALSPIKFGIKAGIQGQGMTLDRSKTFSSLSAEGNLGYNAGVMARISLGPVYLQPELVYGSNRFRMNGPDNSSAKFSVKNMEVPVLVGFKFLFLRFMAGPTFNLLNETNVKAGGNLPQNFSTDVHKSTIGFQLGAGVEFRGVNIDIRYGGQFKRPYQNLTYGSQMERIDTKINAWQINLGYFF